MAGILKKAALVLVTGLVLTACGQKGPLFLPEKNSAQAQTGNSESCTGDNLCPNAEES